LLLVVGLAASFGHNFAEMWIRWFPAWGYAGRSLYYRIVEGESYYTHGPIIPFVSLVIVFLILRHLRVPVKPRWRLGLLVLVPSLLLHLVSCLARVNFTSGFAMIGVLVGLVLCLWGTAALKRLWFPIAFLIFMVPLPEVTISQWNFRLKMFAADVGVSLAGLLGVIVERVGNRVFLSGGKSLVIANVCNGLRTLISLLAFGAVYVYVCRLRGWWRVLLFALTVPVAIVANSIRIVSLILVADIWDVTTATGWYHDLSGLMIFALVFLLMFGLERLILWARRAVGRPATVLPLFHDARRTADDERQWARLIGAIRSPRGIAVVVLLGATATGAWYLNRSIPAVWNQQLARKAVPRELNILARRFGSYDLTLDDRTLAILETRDYLYRRFVEADGTTWIDLVVIFSQDNRKGTHPPDVCLEGLGREITAVADVTLEGTATRGPVQCRELLVQSSRTSQYYLYTYKCGRRYTNSFWVQQLTIFWNGLLRRNASGALIEISTPVRQDVHEARRLSKALLREVVPYLDNNLP